MIYNYIIFRHGLFKYYISIGGMGSRQIVILAYRGGGCKEFVQTAYVILEWSLRGHVKNSAGFARET